jgi:biotin operon repressor
MPNEYESKIRDLRNGDWYWIHKRIIQQYLPVVGSTGMATYNFLASLADKAQTCFPSQKYIAEHLGYSRATICRALKRLASAGLIRIKKRSRYHCVYSLMKVKPRCGTSETQMSRRCNSDVARANTNNNKLTRNINNIDNENKNILILKALKGFKPKTREELLALDIARELNDLQSLPLYLSYSKKYPESLLRMLLGEVMELPLKKIKKGRAAPFNYLVKKYAKKASKNYRD